MRTRRNRQSIHRHPVAARAKVSRAWLYAQTGFRDQIRQLTIIVHKPRQRTTPPNAVRRIAAATPGSRARPHPRTRQREPPTPQPARPPIRTAPRHPPSDVADTVYDTNTQLTPLNRAKRPEDKLARRSSAISLRSALFSSAICEVTPGLAPNRPPAADPGSQRLRGPDPQHARHRSDRRPLRGVLRPHLSDHAHRTLPKLIGILTRTSHNSNPPKIGSLRKSRDGSHIRENPSRPT